MLRFYSPAASTDTGPRGKKGALWNSLRRDSPVRVQLFCIATHHRVSHEQRRAKC